MSYVLGIHIGHHSSCAIVSEGRVVAAVQQERLSRIKHDGEEALSNRLPVNACLETAGIQLSDIDYIISSFQTVSPGSFGLHKPLIENDFILFDPWDKRHFVISHHLAHAYCAFGVSGYEESAILICDLAGSSTLDGRDFHMTFSDWYNYLTSQSSTSALTTECVSIYDSTTRKMSLRHREFCVPHNQPESFIQNIGSLYDNISRFVFAQENADGQLMALAAYTSYCGKEGAALFSDIDLVHIDNEENPTFRNDWQHKVIRGHAVEWYAWLAAACQSATEKALLAYVRKARRLSNSRNLAVAGGVFLNILANTRIVESRLFDRYSVPSAPHDAGISLGCAFYGDQLRKKRSYPSKYRSDRLGPVYSDEEINTALKRRNYTLRCVEVNIPVVAHRLANGEIIARWSGRSEFGPRALGGRSLLGSPLSATIKDRLNKIKGRQSWRPVAPIILYERLEEFFHGPADSPYMNFQHQIKPEHVSKLPALVHPDGSTRVQSLKEEVDPELYCLLREFGTLTDYPILVNTSLNGPGQPIVEMPDEALDFLLMYDEVDALLVGSQLIIRRAPWECQEIKKKVMRLRDGQLLNLVFSTEKSAAFIGQKSQSLQIDHDVFQIICSLLKGKLVDDVLQMTQYESTRHSLFALIRKGILEIVDE